jgi:hypothetical protein
MIKDMGFEWIEVQSPGEEKHPPAGTLSLPVLNSSEGARGSQTDEAR